MYVESLYLMHSEISLIFPSCVSFLRASADDQLNILRRVFEIFDLSSLISLKFLA